MRDFKLVLTPDFKIDFEYDAVAGDFVFTETMADTVKNNIILSLAYRKGDLAGKPSFGSTRYDIKTSGSAAARELEGADRTALKWIVDAGRAKFIEVTAVPDASDKTRINERVVATLNDGETVPFETFLKVV